MSVVFHTFLFFLLGNVPINVYPETFLNVYKQFKNARCNANTGLRAKSKLKKFKKTFLLNGLITGLAVNVDRNISLGGLLIILLKPLASNGCVAFTSSLLVVVELFEEIRELLGVSPLECHSAAFEQVVHNVC